MENCMINFVTEQLKIFWHHDLLLPYQMAGAAINRLKGTPTPSVTNQLPAPNISPALPTQTPSQTEQDAKQYQQAVIGIWNQVITKKLGNQAAMRMDRTPQVGPRLINMALTLGIPSHDVVEAVQRELRPPLQAIFKNNNVNIDWTNGRILITVPHPKPWSPGAEHVLKYTPQGVPLEHRMESQKREDLQVFVGLNRIGQPVPIRLHEAPMLGFIGSTGYGKTTVIKAALYGLCKRNSPRRVKFAVIAKKTGGWGLMKRWPHCIGVYSPSKTEEIAKLVNRLQRSIEERTETVENGWDMEPSIILVLDDAADVLAANKAILNDLEIIYRSGREARIYSWLSAQGAGEKTMTGSTSIDNNISVRLAFYAPNAGAAYRNFGRSGVDLTQLQLPGDAYISVNGCIRIATPYVENEELATLCNDEGNDGIEVGDTSGGVSTSSGSSDIDTFPSGSHENNEGVSGGVLGGVSEDEGCLGITPLGDTSPTEVFEKYYPAKKLGKREPTDFECMAIYIAVRDDHRTKNDVKRELCGGKGTSQTKRVDRLLERGKAALNALQPGAEDTEPMTFDSNDLDIMDQIGKALGGNDDAE